MAIFGVGASFGGDDVSPLFIKMGVVGTGWSSNDAPELQEYFKQLKVGDIVYIKSTYAQRPIRVKAIGLITDNILRNDGDTNELLSIGRNACWIVSEPFDIPRPNEKNNVRSNTIYEEFHPMVQGEIIKKISEKVNKG